MAANSAIGWTDDSVNFWWGCVGVDPGCDNCYAESFSKRLGKDLWGAKAPREEKPNAFKALASFQRKAAKEGTRRRVFLNSMSDLAEILPFEHPSSAMMASNRALFIEKMLEGAYPDLDLIWLTKRIGNVPKIVPRSWMEGEWPANLWLVPTITSQKAADRDIPKLLRIPAPIRGLSMEPLLGPVDLNRILIEKGEDEDDDAAIHAFESCSGEPGLSFIIVGGESGPKARPMHPDWARSLRDQCVAAGVPFFFKQWGEFEPVGWVHAHSSGALVRPDGHVCSDRAELAVSHNFEMRKVGKKAAGRVLDGRAWDEMPVTPAVEREVYATRLSFEEDGL